MIAKHSTILGEKYTNAVHGVVRTCQMTILF